ncbi:unnamed protein product [Coregonus sp. 'balchen']|nr:unnamed protein product [Coregonus sp. 'balchen']
MVLRVLPSQYARSADGVPGSIRRTASVNPSLGVGWCWQCLCPALRSLLSDGLKPHQSDLDLGARRPKLQPWGLVHRSYHQARYGTLERSTEGSGTLILQWPSTQSLHSLQARIGELPQLRQNKHRFNAFLLGLLNIKLLDFWLSHLQSCSALLPPPPPPPLFSSHSTPTPSVSSLHPHPTTLCLLPPPSTPTPLSPPSTPTTTPLSPPSTHHPHPSVSFSLSHSLLHLPLSLSDVLVTFYRPSSFMRLSLTSCQPLFEELLLLLQPLSLLTLNLDLLFQHHHLEPANHSPEILSPPNQDLGFRLSPRGSASQGRGSSYLESLSELDFGSVEPEVTNRNASSSSLANSGVGGLVESLKPASLSVGPAKVSGGLAETSPQLMWVQEKEIRELAPPNVEEASLSQQAGQVSTIQWLFFP